MLQIAGDSRSSETGCLALQLGPEVGRKNPLRKKWFSFFVALDAPNDLDCSF